PQCTHPCPTRRSSDLVSAQGARIGRVGRHLQRRLGQTGAHQSEPQQCLHGGVRADAHQIHCFSQPGPTRSAGVLGGDRLQVIQRDRKSTRLNSSHVSI